MKVKRFELSILALYALLLASNLYAAHFTHSWIIFGSSVFVVFWLFKALCITWPLISFPKPERIDGATYTQPILAWRMWNMSEDHLKSVAYSYYRWPPKEKMAAYCYRCSPVYCIPHPACSCGIYAKKNISYGFWCSHRRSGPSLQDPAAVMPRSWGVLGLVYLWGNIIEGDDGYRAQFAYPAKLFIVDKIRQEEIRKMAARYGIPCEKFSWWQKRKFKNGGTQWISVQYEELSQSSLLSSLFQTESQSKSLST